MNLYYFHAATGNFGDDLNAWLWPRIIPNVHDSARADWLVGIGTILDDRILTLNGSKLIVGSGYRPGAWQPVVPSDWEILFVRGPLTANALALDCQLALSDPGLLVAHCFDTSTHRSNAVGFVPHYFTANMIDCSLACSRAGVTFIDPRWDVERVIAAIDSVDRVIVEAMHGAIVADALEVPWQRVKFLSWRRESTQVAEFKWKDWMSTLNIAPSPPIEGHAPFRTGRGARVVNRLLQHRQVRELTALLKKARNTNTFTLSKAAHRRKLITEMTCRIAEAFSY